MNYITAESILSERMEQLLKDNKLFDIFSYEIVRKKDKSVKGSHDFEDKVISINKDNLYIDFLLTNNEEDRVYTPFHKANIKMAIVDNILITQFHEVIHGRDFLFPRDNITNPEDLERIALEDICTTNNWFYQTFHEKLLYEARAIKQSFYETRDFFINSEFTDSYSADLRVLEAVNYDISQFSKIKPLRTQGHIESKERDYNFYSFSELENSLNAFENSVVNSSFMMPMANSESPFMVFSIDENDSHNIFIELKKLNENVSKLGFTNEFYKTLSIKERLYLHAAINCNFYYEYKKLNPAIKNLPSRLQRWLDMEVLDPRKLDLDYFRDKLRDFNLQKSLLEEQQPKSELEPQHSSDLF